MNEPIELTDAEVLTVAHKAWTMPTHPEDRQGCLDTVREVIDALNRVRTGDAVGTIRRTDNGIIALLTADDVAAPWRAFMPNGIPLGRWTHRQVSLWPVVFSPGVEP